MSYCPMYINVIKIIIACYYVNIKTIDRKMYDSSIIVVSSRYLL